MRNTEQKESPYWLSYRFDRVDLRLLLAESGHSGERRSDSICTVRSEFAAVPTILRLKLFRPDRFFAGQLTVIASLTALMVRYLAAHLVAVDGHAVPPVLNFLLLFWHEHPDIRKTKYKYGSC